MLNCGHRIGGRNGRQRRRTISKTYRKAKAARAAAAEADAAVDDYIATMRVAKIAEMQKVIADYSFTVAELFGAIATTKPKSKAKSKRGPAVVKYRDEQGNTWGWQRPAPCLGEGHPRRRR